VTVRLPPFWAERPAVWIAQAEAQFFLVGVSSEKTKYFHVISQLYHRYAAEVEDIITSSPEQQIPLQRRYRIHPLLVQWPIRSPNAKLYRALRLPPAEETNAADITGCSTMTGRLFVTDSSSKRQFVVDTGSDLCMYPRRLAPRRKERANYDLCAANGTTIHIYGWLPLSLNLGLRRDFTWRFVVADVTHPIIGVDFLSHFCLLVDCRKNRLLEGVTSLAIQAQAASELIPSVKTITDGTRRIPGPHSSSRSPVRNPP
jgi:hypothetical protein